MWKYWKVQACHTSPGLTPRKIRTSPDKLPRSAFGAYQIQYQDKLWSVYQFKYYIRRFADVILEQKVITVVIELLDSLYNTFQIIKICYSIIKRNIFWGFGAVFKKIRE